MMQINQILGDVCDSNSFAITDYINIFRTAKKNLEKNGSNNKKTIKIGILSSFTLAGFKECLFVKCASLGIYADFYICDYGQYYHDIFNTDSELYKFSPDIIIVLIDTMTLLGENFLLPYEYSDEHRKANIDEKISEVTSAIQILKERSSSKIFFNNFEVPGYSPLGILENKQKFGFFESIEYLNFKIKDIYKEDSQIFIFDFNAFCSKVGKLNTINYKLYYLGDIKINPDIIPELCNDYMSYIKPVLSISRKCIILDLDNTLWGGIIGEDGFDGIKLGPTAEGKPFFEMQKYLLSLAKRGVILAINSKNNYEDAMRVIKSHPYMILKEENFSSIQINWDNKVTNIQAISKELNIGLDSLVFVDDDKINRNMVKEFLPEVYVTDLPEDSALYLDTIRHLDVFNILSLTNEDIVKGKLYVEERERKNFAKEFVTMDSYYKSLHMILTFESANSFNVPRISQLTQKTNQFNFTTKRYLEEDIQTFAKSDTFLVICCKYEDRFGDSGITGVVIIKKEMEYWVIETFLLSCRILGRQIENAVLGYIFEEAKRYGVSKLFGEYIQTEKNIIIKDFYKNNGFKMIENNIGKQTWECVINEENVIIPEFIEVIRMVE